VEVLHFCVSHSNSFLLPQSVKALDIIFVEMFSFYSCGDVLVQEYGNRVTRVLKKIMRYQDVDPYFGSVPPRLGYLIVLFRHMRHALFLICLFF